MPAALRRWDSQLARRGLTNLPSTSRGTARGRGRSGAGAGANRARSSSVMPGAALKAVLASQREPGCPYRRPKLGRRYVRSSGRVTRRRHGGFVGRHSRALDGIVPACDRIAATGLLRATVAALAEASASPSSDLAIAGAGGHLLGHQRSSGNGSFRAMHLEAVSRRSSGHHSTTRRPTATRCFAASVILLT